MKKNFENVSGVNVNEANGSTGVVRNLSLENREEMGKRIAEMRKELGMSQDDMGAELHLERNQYRKMEKASVVPKLDYLVMLSGIFGVSLDYLVFGEQAKDEKAAVIEDIESVCKGRSVEELHMVLRVINAMFNG